MKKILKEVELLKNNNVKNMIDARMNEFAQVWEKPSKEIFKEYCFCALTANFDAQKAIRIQNAIGNGFLTLTEKQLASKLQQLGHRFPNTRAKYIAKSRKHKSKLKSVLQSFNSDFEKREWLVNNMVGLGYKEASHFLRNVSHKDLAIIDFHIIDLLAKHDLIERPKTITRKKYLEMEGLLKKIAEKSNLSLGELDLYLWYMETGKVLK